MIVVQLWCYKLFEGELGASPGRPPIKSGVIPDRQVTFTVKQSAPAFVTV
jgi:hypothetical protein